MEPWEGAIEEFLKPWRTKKEVVGALLCGSYAVGTETSGSDIDIHLILSAKTKWRERGNKVVKGFLIEYFANPVPQLELNRREDMAKGRKIDARMFTTGRILFDKTGAVRKLVEGAKKDLRKPLKRQSAASTGAMKYALWDAFDGVEDLFSTQNPDFRKCAFALVEQAIESYAKYLRVEIPGSAKRYRYLRDPIFVHNYQIKMFPDKKFANLYVACVKTKTDAALLSSVRTLLIHTQARMGGFNIDGWKLRTAVKS